MSGLWSPFRPPGGLRWCSPDHHDGSGSLIFCFFALYVFLLKLYPTDHPAAVFDTRFLKWWVIGPCTHTKKSCFCDHKSKTSSANENIKLSAGQECHPPCGQVEPAWLLKKEMRGNEQPQFICFPSGAAVGLRNSSREVVWRQAGRLGGDILHCRWRLSWPDSSACFSKALWDSASVAHGDIQLFPDTLTWDHFCGHARTLSSDYLWSI